MTAVPQNSIHSWTAFLPVPGGGPNYPPNASRRMPNSRVERSLMNGLAPRLRGEEMVAESRPSTSFVSEGYEFLISFGSWESTGRSTMTSWSRLIGMTRFIATPANGFFVVITASNRAGVRAECL